MSDIIKKFPTKETLDKTDTDIFIENKTKEINDIIDIQEENEEINTNLKEQKKLQEENNKLKNFF